MARSADPLAAASQVPDGRTPGRSRLQQWAWPVRKASCCITSWMVACHTWPMLSSSSCSMMPDAAAVAGAARLAAASGSTPFKSELRERFLPREGCTASVRSRIVCVHAGRAAILGWQQYCIAICTSMALTPDVALISRALSFGALPQCCMQEVCMLCRTLGWLRGGLSKLLIDRLVEPGSDTDVHQFTLGGHEWRNHCQ